MLEDQRDEIEALRAIYDSDFSILQVSKALQEYYTADAVDDLISEPEVEDETPAIDVSILRVKLSAVNDLDAQ